MIVNLRLQQVLESYGENPRGLAQRLAKYAELDRHTVSSILNGEVKHLNLAALAKLCDYLVETYHIPPGELPGLIFSIEPEHFCGEVVNREHLEVVLGVRTIRESSAVLKASGHGPDRVKAKQRWVMASDSTLHGELFHELFGRGGHRWAARPNRLEQRLVPSYAGPESQALVQAASEKTYDAFHALPDRRACFCVGSIKSNGVSEVIMARTFRTTAFLPEDNVADPRERRCPVFIRYREDDPRPLSCHAGMRLARRHPAKTPGIYYETPDGAWECCPVDDRRDAALVLFANHVVGGRLEIIMAGFTGRATRCLGTNLRSLAEKFWPPAYQQPKLHLGLFLVTFQFDRAPRPDDVADEVDLPAPTDIKVIPLAKEVLARRFD